MEVRTDVESGQAPLGRKLFQFALIADTHVNEEENKSTSTYATNAFANGRARFVFESIAQLEPPPSFAVHLGDIVHPVPVLPTFEVAVDRFKGIASSIKCPLYLIPGNHDVGDKQVEWMPAGTVTAEHIDKYRRLFGPDFFAFDQGGCRFVALNAQIINSGLVAEQEQRIWFEAEVKSWIGKRCFLFIHYPPYVSDPEESGSYDNIDEPGRSWLLDLVKKYVPEAVFAGHVHNFWYDGIGKTEMYLLPATSFLRHDYSELFKTSPAQEFGRNDTNKFGYFLVDVHEHGHIAHFVRTDGQTLAEGESLSRGTPRLAPIHTRTNVEAVVGVDLRHPWAELVEIAATGGVQEFERKLARNDYPLLALWEMGVRRLRVPLQDVLDSRVRDRMRLLQRMGHEFLVYSYDMPSAESQQVVMRASGLVSALEVVLPWARLRSSLADLAALRARTQVDIYVSKLRTHEDAKFDGSRFSHFINHGFHIAETHQIKELFEDEAFRSAVDGLSFRVSRRDSVSETFKELSRLRKEFGFRPLAHVRLASDHPGDVMDDDAANACRVAEAVLVSAIDPEISAYIDTFMDVDRGYFPRNGFIDRLCNPRLPLRVYANLHSVLSSIDVREFAGSQALLDNAGLIFRSDEGGVLALVTSPPRALADLSSMLASSSTQRCTLVDLASGTIAPITKSHQPRDGGTPSGPHLIILDRIEQELDRTEVVAPIAS